MKTASISTPSAGLAFGQSRVARCLAIGLRMINRLAPELAARLALDLFFTPLPLKLGARARASAPWQIERIACGGQRVALLRHATARLALPARPRALLVHGWAGSARQMQALGEALAAAGWEPVLLDLPAHGHSDGVRCTMPQIVASLFAVQQHLGPATVLVAHSMGAVGSLHAVATGLGAQRLVVMAPSSSPASVLRWFGEVFGLRAELLTRMRQRIELIESTVLEQFEPAWWAPRLKVPVLVIHDRDDRMAPLANGQALARALSHAELRVIDGSSHRRMLADPRVIEATLAHVSLAKPSHLGAS
jgi:pimeloyl-ACP methyl ester carboxylesterase